MLLKLILLLSLFPYYTSPWIVKLPMFSSTLLLPTSVIIFDVPGLDLSKCTIQICTKVDNLLNIAEYTELMINH